MTASVDSFHKELGSILWDHCGMERTRQGLMHALGAVRALWEEYWRDVTVPGSGEQLNHSLERAGRVADFLELGELMCIDALHRDESCGCHFRAEHQSADGEALRDDGHYAYVAAWEHTGGPPVLHKEHLAFEHVEPWRADPFPVVKDLVVDRGALDRIIQSGGYISIPTGSAPEAHSTLVPKDDAEAAFDAATCIGCGACVAACPNGSAALFLGAKITHLGLLPQGRPERYSRALDMIGRHDSEGFGGCTQIGECTAVCPKDIQLDVISRCHRDVLAALFHHEKQRKGPLEGQAYRGGLVLGEAGD